MGESCQSRHGLGLDRLGIIPFCSVRNLVFRMCVVRFGIRADNRRFYNYISLPQRPVLRRGLEITKWVNFFRTRFLSEPDLRLFLSNWLLIPFPPPFSPPPPP